MSALIVLSTFSDPDTARRVTRTLVEEKLAACANLLPNVESVYWWKGAVETATETTAILKTTGEVYPRLEARLRELHPYELPEIISIRPAGGLPDYLQWIAENCR